MSTRNKKTLEVALCVLVAREINRLDGSDYEVVAARTDDAMEDVLLRSRSDGYPERAVQVVTIPNERLAREDTDTRRRIQADLRSRLESLGLNHAWVTVYLNDTGHQHRWKPAQLDRLAAMIAKESRSGNIVEHPDPAGERCDGVTCAAIYVRRSPTTDEQAEKFGLASQLSELRALAAQKGYAVPDEAEFADDDDSGAALDRPALTRLRDAVRAGAFQVVLIHDPDRLARKLAYQLLLLEEFDRAGVRYEFLTTPTEKTPEGALLLHVKGAVAEHEREKIRERTLRGKREKARRGLIVGGPTPYGWRRDPQDSGKLVVDRDEARILVQMFQWLVTQQRSTRWITAELTRQGVRPPRGQAWALSSVARVLRDPIYVGRAYYNRRQWSGTSYKPRAESEWIAIPVPAIIDPTLYAQAQAQLGTNRQRYQGRPGTRFYLLKGLVRCGSCGRSMPGWPSKGKPMYRCTGRNGFAPRPCPSPQRVPQERLEALVWDTVAGVLRNPAVLARKLETYRTKLGVREVEIVSELEYLRRQLLSVERQERKLLDLYLADDVPTGAARERLEGITRRRAGLQERLVEVERQKAAQEVEEGRQDAIRRYCQLGLSRGIPRLNPEGRRRLLQTLLDEVVVAGSAVIIHGALPSQAPDTKGDQTMPNITIQWYAGRTAEQRREIVKAITEAMVKIGKTTPDQVHIVFQDVEKAYWGFNGKLASDPS